MMIGKQVKGKSFRGVLNYLMGKEDAILIDKNMIGDEPNALTSEFKISQSLKPNVKKCVYHVSLSLPANEHLSDQQWSQVGQRYLKEMGFEKSQFVMIRHTDTPHEHIHIVASRIGMDGKVVSDSHDYRRSEKVIRGIEKDFGLQQVAPSRDSYRRAPKSRELRKAVDEGKPSVRFQLQEMLDLTISSSFNMSEFVHKLELLGIGVRANIAKTGTITGISFIYEGVALKGSDLGRGYTWNAIQKRGISYEQDRDFQNLFTAKLRAEAMGNKSANREFAQSRHEKDRNFGRTVASISHILSQSGRGSANRNRGSRKENLYNRESDIKALRSEPKHSGEFGISAIKGIFSYGADGAPVDSSDYEHLLRLGQMTPQGKGNKKIAKALNPFDLRIKKLKAEKEKQNEQERQKETKNKLRGRGIDLDIDL